MTVVAQKGVVSLGATDARLSFIEGTGVEDRRVVVDASVEALNEALGVDDGGLGVCGTASLGCRRRRPSSVDDGGGVVWAGPLPGAVEVSIDGPTAPGT